MNVKKHLEPREQRLRAAAARLAWQNHGLYRVAMKVKPFYRGDTVTPPKYKHRLEKALNPKSNGADAIIDEFAEALKAYMPGEYPLQPLRLAYRSTRRLIEEGLEKVRRLKTLNCLMTLLDDLKSYLTVPKPDWTIKQHLNWIDAVRHAWKLGCYKNSDDYYTFTTEVLERAEAAALTESIPPARTTRPPARSSYKTRPGISLKRAGEISGFSQRTIQNLEKVPKNSGYPGRNISETAFLAWALGYQTEKVRKHWANMMNHPIPLSSLPQYLQEKLAL